MYQEPQAESQDVLIKKREQISIAIADANAQY